MSLYHRYRLVIASVLYALTILGAPARAVDGQSEDEIAPITARMQQFVDEGQIAGAVTLVAHDGKIVHLSAAGQTDIEGKRPMQTDTVFAIASMTKPITATAVMILQDEGKLCVEDRVSKYIPAFRDVRLNGEPPSREITIRDLMTHTSGIGGSQQNQGTLEETVQSRDRKIDDRKMKGRLRMFLSSIFLSSNNPSRPFATFL